MLIPQVPFSQVLAIGQSLNNFPVSVNSPNFFLEELLFTQAFIQFGRLATPFIVNGLPPGVQPPIFNPGSFTFASVSDTFNTTDNFLNFNSLDANTTAAYLPATDTEIRPNIVGVFDTATGIENGTLYDISDPGDTIDTLISFGELDNNIIASLETIGGQDAIDLYHFSISETNLFAAVLVNLEADVDLGVFDLQGQLIASSENVGTADEAIATILDGGDYIVGVVSADGLPSNYDLGLITDDGTSFAPAPTQPFPSEVSVF